ncbi:MAG: sugar phosphate isomerase/epimerase family protein, partial [Planctomycetota bacterium]
MMIRNSNAAAQPATEHQPVTRRQFLMTAGGVAVIGGAGMAHAMSAATAATVPARRDVTATSSDKEEAAKNPARDKLFSISLAQWSLHRMLFGGELNAMDFPKFTKETFGIEAVEYVNSFYRDRVENEGWARDLRKRADDAGVRSLLIMVDREGHLGDPDTTRRRQAVDNHRKWLDAAKVLGCHSIRVNAHSEGPPQVQAERAADGLRQLCEVADPMGLNVLVENHGGLSSAGVW